MKTIIPNLLLALKVNALLSTAIIVALSSPLTAIGAAIAQQTYLKASNSGRGDSFGRVAVSAETVVVGAPFEASNATGINGNQTDNSAISAGAAYVFVRSGTNWTQQAYLKASNTDGFDQFGWSVALSGDTVVVGAPFEASNATGINGDQTDNSAYRAGAVYVFVRSGTNWSQQAYLKAFNTDGFDQFGGSVAVAGDTVIVGAPGDGGTGSAYVFVRSGTNWTQQAFLKASNPNPGDSFGSSVAISGETVVVGALDEDSNATGVNGNQSDNSAFGSGAAYVFVRSGTNWRQQAYLKASNTGGDDTFGLSVALSGDTVVVGAPFEDSNATGVNGNQSDNSATSSGAAYVFVRSGTNWTQQAYLKASNSGEDDHFGANVAVSGDSLVIGAQDEDRNATGVNGNQGDDNSLSSGAAYVLVRRGADWSQLGYVKASNTGQSDGFGASVAISGDTVVVGAPFESSNATGVNGNQNDNSAPEAGAAYVFTTSCTVTSGPPVITLDPQDRELVAGSTATLSVDACGATPLSYQWYKNNIALANGGRVSGATSADLTLADVQPSDAGAYHAIVSNSLGSAVSETAVLRVIDLAWTSGGHEPWLDQSLVTHDGEGAAQSGAVFDLQESWLQTTVTGPGTLAFWWRVSSEMDYDVLEFSVDGVVQHRISGEEDWEQASFAIAAGSHTLRWRYAKDDSTALGQDSAWLDEVVFALNSGSPVVLAQPVSQRAGLGDTITLAAGVAGGIPRGYQWFKDENGIAGAVNASLTLSNVGPSDVGLYRVVVTNTLGGITSSNALLNVTVNGPVDTILLFTEQPSTSPYQAALNSMGASYQLFTDPVAFNTAVANANPATSLVVVDPILSSKSLNAVGPFANGGGRAIMQYFGLNAVSRLAGAFNASVQEALLSAPRPIYNWGSPFFGGLNSPIPMSSIYNYHGQRLQPMSGGQAVAGYTTTPIVNQAAIVIGHSGRTVLNGFNMQEVSPLSDAVRLAQNELQFLLASVLTILAQPTNQNVRLGGAVINAVGALSPAGPITYQWRFNGTNILGATNATLAITNAQLAHEGVYSVVVSDSVNSVTSSNASLTVLINLAVTQQALSQSVVAGGNVTFSVAVSGYPPPFGYEWRRLSPATSLASNVSNERIAFFTMTNVQMNQVGNYRVIIRNIASPNGVPSVQATLTVLADSDGDGLPDVWETAYPNCIDPALDCDNDGLTNLEEYRAGTDPTNAASGLRIDRIIAGNSATLEFQNFSNKTYTVQHTDRVGNGSWLKLADVVARATNRTETIIDSGAGTNRYYRVVTPRQP